MKSINSDLTVQYNSANTIWVCTRLSLKEAQNTVNDNYVGLWELNELAPQPDCENKGKPYVHYCFRRIE